MNDPKVFTADWCESCNFGDALMPMFVDRFAGVWPVLVKSGHRLVLGGSILNWADEDCCVWGAGLAYRTHKVNPAARLYAVRGPISADIARDCGNASQPVLGDPALLVSWVFPWAKVNMPKAYRTGYFPHYADWRGCYEAYRHDGQVDDYWGNVLAPTSDVVLAISRCTEVLTSSLHVLIVADALGVPSRLCHWGGQILGDGMKYEDYCLSVGRTQNEPAKMEKVRALQQGLVQATELWRRHHE